jgi:FkbM family methyltransferase
MLSSLDNKQKRLRDLFTPSDNWRYLLWRFFRSRNQITVTLQNQEKIILRALPAPDLDTAYEIFLARAYQKPTQVPEVSPHLIVDIGANVGYSIVYLAHEYPNANFVSFEPHPIHFAMLEQHLKINHLSSRVHIENSAVSNCNTKMFLENAGCQSALVEDDRSNCLLVNVCDFFTWIGTQTVDLLKMDIEGGEYAILNDPRFETVNVSTIVMEWHNTKETPDGCQWCSNRLISLGYEITHSNLKFSDFGILWAWKN